MCLQKMKQKASLAACPTSQLGILIVGLISSWMQNERGQSKKKKKGNRWIVGGGGGSGETAAVVFMVNQVCLALCSICLLLLPYHM